MCNYTPYLGPSWGPFGLSWGSPKRHVRAPGGPSGPQNGPERAHRLRKGENATTTGCGILFRLPAAQLATGAGGPLVQVVARRCFRLRFRQALGLRLCGSTSNCPLRRHAEEKFECICQQRVPIATRPERLRALGLRRAAPTAIGVCQGAPLILPGRAPYFSGVCPLFCRGVPLIFPGCAPYGAPYFSRACPLFFRGAPLIAPERAPDPCAGGRALSGPLIFQLSRLRLLHKK